MKSVRMKFELKQEHIDKGSPCKSSKCPIALCLHEYFDVDIICVGTSTISFVTGDFDSLQRWVVKSTNAMRDWIDKFDVYDGYKKSKPMSFTLNVPADLARLAKNALTKGTN